MSTSLVDLDFTLLYDDNMRVIATATNSDDDKTAWTRHINIHYHITREALMNEILWLRYIQTAEIIINILNYYIKNIIHKNYNKQFIFKFYYYF